MELLALFATNSSSCASTAPATSSPPRSVRSTASPDHRVPIVDACFLSARDRVTREVPESAPEPFTWVCVTRSLLDVIYETGITPRGSPPYQKRVGSTRRRLGGLVLGDAEPRFTFALAA